MTKCIVCSSEFVKAQVHHKYCTKECGREAMNSQLLKTRKITAFQIFRRDDFRCIYCGRSSVEDGIKLHVDHILPKSRGGKHKNDNYITSCQRCNSSKHNQLLPDEQLKRIQGVVLQRNTKFKIPNIANFLEKDENYKIFEE